MDYSNEKTAELAAKVKEKLEKEKKNVAGNKEKAMANAVMNALCCFAAQDGEFADAIVTNSQTFSDCMKAVAKGVGNCISDLDAFKKAVQFYFPGADVDFVMQVRVNPFDTLDAGRNEKAEPEIKTLSLLDILG